MEEFILDFVSFIGHLDFSMVFRIFLILYGVFWFFILIWVWFDACDKSDKWIFRIFSVLLVLVFNILGLIIYFLIRPAQSYEDRYWQELEKKYLEFETGGLTNCKSCDFPLDSSFANCPNCGKGIKVRCGGCDTYIDPSWKFCGYCGFEREVEKEAEEVELEVEEVEIPASEEKEKKEKDIEDEVKVEEEQEEDVIDIDKALKKEKARRKVERAKMKGREFVHKGKLKLSGFFATVGKKSSKGLDSVKAFLRHGESEELEEPESTEAEPVRPSVKEKSEKKKKKSGKKKKKKGNKKSKRK